MQNRKTQFITVEKDFAIRKTNKMHLRRKKVSLSLLNAICMQSRTTILVLYLLETF